MRNLEDLDNADAPERPSKSQKKRDMHALQDMGAALVELSAERLARIEMPDALRDALREAQRLTRHEARRRQMQYGPARRVDLDQQPCLQWQCEQPEKSEGQGQRELRGRRAPMQQAEHDSGLECSHQQ